MKKGLKIFGIILAVMFLSVVGYGFYLYNSLTNTVDQMHESIDRPVSDKREKEVNMEEQEPLSFLITGVDSRGDNHSGRSDTIIVMTVNPKEKSVKMLSIPRDTRTEIIGRGFQDKINHAYAFGGVQMTINTVENFLNIPIDHYASINMEGFKGLVDALGGVTVDNAFAFQQDGFTFNEGELFLNGDEALAYSRMRYEDPRGDFGRNDRQRQIVDAVIQEGAQFSSITKAGQILSAVGESVRTDLDLNGIWAIQSNYKEARHNVEQMEITGSGKRIDGIYYLQIPDEEVNRVSQELRAHLELDTSNTASSQ
ncbi:transcriptional regulator [Alkalihalobacillus alcalophilus ATCC 27647 = CGMCC 1.3604]|uniref:Polyisoprenyl-teichoic acid--peptidoglycan teichoic acid transferase TagU n=1 Tax=Alkalihalobacillus alcalophilus ATCC 27647 = CGMCC 1.3604 TaxID=1218173 RepID=A0A094YQQ9_ALKAL|nr:LCP family protein [Alkalihalobacillus alcalophilus]KGA95767.1 trascriptional regulator [Alkalihalobacillus alcalophilus ATCC 27647 = CGMCC 1.3604]MED1563829.1 LCP family protein [Alkalihalobacillus alcalophilus]THG92051.1 transcriptional regulator [Alkalihalobacillus alcalophilus ATCC 27647 = CGMCC 1.3604]